MKCSQSCHHQEIRFTHLQNLQFWYLFPEIISACSKNSSMSQFWSFTDKTGFSSSSSGDSDGEVNLQCFNGPGAVSSISIWVHKEMNQHYLWWSQRMTHWWSQLHQDPSHCWCHCGHHLHLWWTCWNTCTKNLVPWLKAQKVQQWERQSLHLPASVVPLSMLLNGKPTQAWCHWQCPKLCWMQYASTWSSQ